MKKAEYLAKLEAENNLRKAMHGSTNAAIDAHIAKIKPMTEDQFLVHQAALTALSSGVRVAVKRMAAEINRK